jgi:hypothetical protein
VKQVRADGGDHERDGADHAELGGLVDQALKPPYSARTRATKAILSLSSPESSS